MLSNHLILFCCPPTSTLFWFRSFPALRSFPMSQIFTSGGCSIAQIQYILSIYSNSASVLIMNIQGWFPLGLIGLISLLSKGLSKVFSNTTIVWWNWVQLLGSLNTVWHCPSLRLEWKLIFSSSFPSRSLVFPILLFSSISLHCSCKYSSYWGGGGRAGIVRNWATACFLAFIIGVGSAMALVGVLYSSLMCYHERILRLNI